MKTGIMQPYFFPYLGYFQLINFCDQFVLGDDLQYIQRGWVNRNRILMNGKDVLISVPIKKCSYLTLINEVSISDDYLNFRKKLLGQLNGAYGKAPFYKDVIGMLEQALSPDSELLSDLLIKQLKLVCDFLEISTELIKSSQIPKDNELKAEKRVIDINKILNSDHYINPIGGTELYSRENFEKEGLKLNFLKTKTVVYNQNIPNFISNLSIIDVMMFNDKEEIKKMLNEFELI